MENQISNFLDETKKLVDDGFFEIGERKYVVKGIFWRKGRKIYTYFTSVKKHIDSQNLEFMETDKFKEIEKLICQHIDYNNSSIYAIGIDSHFGKYQSDYDSFIFTAFSIFSYPFLLGLNGEWRDTDLKKRTLC